MKISIEEVKNLSRQFLPRVIEIRRHLHAHPELSFQEVETSKYIADILDSLAVEYTYGLAGGTGIVAELGSGDLKLALRADMDALPIVETNDVSYKSTNEGVMHACGHDVHSSILIGVIHVLKQLEDRMSGKIRFIFQPGEERLPGGASLMIKDKALTGVPGILAQHVHPDLPVGKIGYREGNFMASCDELFIDVIGKGGHAAMPHRVIDPILASAAIIQSLQSLVSRNANPITPSVLSIGKIYSHGGATNVIPEKVSMEGTFRTFDEEWRNQAHVRIHEMIQSVAKSQGVKIDLRIEKGYPALYNHPEFTSTVKDSMIEYLGQENVIRLDQRMTAEDFSYYSQLVPACFYRLGTASIDGSKSNAVHTSQFDIDESALEIGMGMMSWLVLDL